MRVFKQKRFEPMPGFETVGPTTGAVGSRTPYVRSLARPPTASCSPTCTWVASPVDRRRGHVQPTIDVDADVHQVRPPGRPSSCWRRRRSACAGATTRRDVDGVTDGCTLVLPGGGDRRRPMFVSASTGPFAEGGGLQEPCRRRRPARALHRRPARLAAAQHRHGLPRYRRFAHRAFGADGVVYISRTGRTWRVLADGLPPVSAVAIDPA
jgi:hypothetical protein